MEVVNDSFEWSSLSGLEGTIVRECPRRSTILAADSLNESIFRLVSGMVVFEEAKEERGKSVKLVYGSLSAKNAWPVFGEISAFRSIVKRRKASKKSSLAVVSASSPAVIQIIPLNILMRFLSKSSTRSCLFYKAMCCHYTAKLKDLHQRKIDQVLDSPTLTSTQDFITINGEALVFLTQVSSQFFSLVKNCLDRVFILIFLCKGASERGDREI